MTGPKTDLILTESTIRDVVKGVHSKFILHTDDLSFHFDNDLIRISIRPGSGVHFILEGDPVDVRLSNSEDRWEYIRRPRD